MDSADDAGLQTRSVQAGLPCATTSATSSLRRRRGVGSGPIDISDASVLDNNTNGSEGAADVILPASMCNVSGGADEVQKCIPTVPGIDPMLKTRTCTSKTSVGGGGGGFFSARIIRRLGGGDGLGVCQQSPASEGPPSALPPPWRRRPRDSCDETGTSLSGAQILQRQSLDMLLSNPAAQERETPLERSRNFHSAVQSYSQTAEWIANPLWIQTFAAGEAGVVATPWDTDFMETKPPATRQVDSRIEYPTLRCYPHIEDELKHATFDDVHQQPSSSSGGSSSSPAAVGIVADSVAYAKERFKTPDEIRKERREAAARKREETLRNVNRKEPHQDRLTRRNIIDKGLLLKYSAEALELKIDAEMQARAHEHDLRNYEAHVAALPHQAEKRLFDLWRDAERSPRLHAYHIPKARNVHCLHRLRHHANDVKLRGFVLWVCEEDAVVVLIGGDVALRHLDRWICEKMDWLRLPADTTLTTLSGDNSHSLMNPPQKPIDPSILEPTRGVLLCSIPLYRVGDMSVLLKSADEGEPDERRRRLERGSSEVRRQSRIEEPVFVRHADTVADAMSFLRDWMPAEGSVLNSFDFIARLVLIHHDASFPKK
mmetsp:Transcript_13434/g.15389  ORF Transcript_13434/g.15389 Transcript_13434/m.15389 type:complete len:601 (+) Transcript_13434:46-1848(+)